MVLPFMSLRDSSELNRRRLLQGLAGGMAGTVAGCLAGDDSGDSDAGDSDSDSDADDSGDSGVPDYTEGGRLEFGIERNDIGNYDQADSSLADDSMIFGAVYDGLFVQNPEGEIYLWMAKEYETVEANDVSAPGDYLDYMQEYEITAVEEGTPILDVDWPNLALLRHPDDMAAVGDGDLGEGDSLRALTRNEAPEAVADGVYGTRVEGTLHEGITFHNGDECTAGDIVGSYDRFVNGALEGQMFDAFLNAEAPNGDDGYDFTLYSQEPDAIAEQSLPPFIIFPQEHHDLKPGELEPREDGPVPVGTGPYEIADFEAGNKFLLERTDNYWVEEVGLENLEWFDGADDFPARPPIEEINIRFVPEGGQRVAALRQGDLDVSYQLPAGDRTDFDNDSDYTVASALSTGFLFKTFSLEDTDEGGAFAHKEARHAVNNLIPRQDIVDIVSEGWGAPAQVPFPAPAAGLATQKSYEEIQNEDWAYPVDPDPSEAADLLDQTDLETPVNAIIETNADDEERQDKMQLVVDEMNQSDLFETALETPADISTWYVENLIAPDSATTYAERNAITAIGLAAGFDPHGYAEALHHPSNHNICCNWHFGEGTFDWIDLLDSCRFGVEVAQDPDLRRDRYDELWPQLADDLGTAIVDYSLETAVAGPDVAGFEGYPDRRGFMTYSLYAPYDGNFAWLDR